MRVKSNSFLLLLMLVAVFLLNGCGDDGEQKAVEKETSQVAQSVPTDPASQSEKDYAEAINSKISQNDGYVKINFPFTTKVKGDDAYTYLYINNMCDALVKQGILTIAATESGERRPLNTYALTPEGQKYFTPDKGLKFADVSVERIVSITDAGIMNLKEVRFTYKLDNIAPWANLAKSDSPSQLLDVIEGNKKAEHLAQIFVVNGKLVVDKARVFNPSTDGDFARSQYEGYK